MGGHLVHRVGAEAEAMVVAEPVGLLQHPGDVLDRHGRVYQSRERPDAQVGAEA
jgi:hypothetical protein